MPITVMRGPGPREAATGVAAAVPELPGPELPGLAAAAGRLQLRTGLGSRVDIEAELDVMSAAIRAFAAKAPDAVLREVAAYSARCTELCVLLHRVEATDRQYTRVRTQQVEKYLVELDRQFKIASRLIEVMRQDLALLGPG